MYAGLTSAFRFIEVWFTVGRGARHIYADFLDEAAQVLGKLELGDVAALFRAAAACWRSLTLALLPDSIAPSKETRELMVRDYELFLSQGRNALAERQSIKNDWRRLRQMSGNTSQFQKPKQRRCALNYATV